MSAHGVQGCGQGWGQLLRSTAAEMSPSRATGRCGRPAAAPPETEDTSSSENVHRHHGHHRGHFFREIQDAVVSALQAAPTDGSVDPNQVVQDAILRVLQGNSHTTPDTPPTPPTTDPTTPPTQDPPAPPTEDPVTPPATDANPPPSEPPPPPAVDDATTATTGTTTPPASGDGAVVSDNTETNGDSDDDSPAVPKASSHHHLSRRVFFETLQNFGITPQQFRDDLIAALREFWGNKSDTSTAVQTFPAGTTVDTAA